MKGPLELKMCLDSLKPMVKEEKDLPGTCKIYEKHPHVTVDTFFVSDVIVDYAGEHGFGVLGTCH